MRSTRSFSRVRTREGQRGIALIWAIALAVLYFMLTELMLIDSARELGEARRFRAKIVAEVLAENAAELAAEQLVSRQSSPRSPAEDWQGAMVGEMSRNGSAFTIIGEGVSKGDQGARAKVTVQGSVDGTDIRIDYTVHTP